MKAPQLPEMGTQVVQLVQFCQDVIEANTGKRPDANTILEAALRNELHVLDDLFLVKKGE